MWLSPGWLLCYVALPTLRGTSGQNLQEPTCGCAADPLRGFVRRSGSVLLDERDRPLRFVSLNVPNLHRIEMPLSLAERSTAPTYTVGGDQAVRVPSQEEVRDALCSLRQLGARVTRLYVLSHGEGEAFHVGPGGVLNEAWFRALDMVLAVAKEMGIRLVIPFLNTVNYEAWGHSGFYSRWTGTGRFQEGAFFQNAQQRQLFKAVLTAVLTRNNTLTGKRYADEEAVLAWELGNEMHDVAFGPFPIPGITPGAPVEWTRDIARHVKSLDPNHLIMDGSQFSAQILEVSELDIVGSTYYGKTATMVGKEIEALEVWNSMRGPEQQKAFIIKEFGLIEQSLDIPEQDPKWVDQVLRIFWERQIVAGAMYWSLRFHADEGGFFHQTEQGGQIKALHWPGFVSGGPTYETEILGLLQQYAYNLSDGSSQPWPGGAVPCVPRLRPGDGAGCLTFRGSAGAAQYELWAALGEGTGVKDWAVVRENVPDHLAPLTALATVDPYALMTTFLGGAPSRSSPFSFCLRACAAPGALRGESWNESQLDCLWDTTANAVPCKMVVPPSCSPCSEKVMLTLDLTKTPACNLTGVWVDYEALWNEYYYSMFDFGGMTEEMELMVTLVSCTALLLIALAWCSGKLVEQVDHAETLAMLRAGTRRVRGLDIVRLIAAVHLTLYAGIRHGWFGAPPTFLACLSSWGPVQFSFIMLYAGFVSAIRYSPRAVQLEVWPLFWQSLARLYPAFFIFASLALLHNVFHLDRMVTGRFIFMLPLPLHAWRSDLQFGVDLSELSWVVGPLLVFRAVLLPLCARLESLSAKSLLALLAVAWAVGTLWQTGHFLNLRIFVLDEAVTWIILRAYAPSYVAGVALGLLFGRYYDNLSNAQGQGNDEDHPFFRSVYVLERAGVTLGACLLPLFLAVDMQSLGSFLGTWLSHGGLLPLQCTVLWSAAAGTDVLARIPLRYLAGALPITSLWYYCLIAPPLAYAVAAPLASGQPFVVQLVAFWLMLVCCAAVGDTLIRGPACRWAARPQLQPRQLGLTLAKVPVKLHRYEATFLYYTALGAVLCTFAFYALDDRTLWLNVATLPSGPMSTNFNIVSLLLFVPSFALLMGLMGLLLLPPTLEPQSKPAKLQLQNQRLAGLEPFKIVFRIVTRGSSPRLVRESVCHAAAVLEANLPPDWWLLEVVTDNPLHLSNLKLPVVELLVPADYAPPGGCLFKARALHYATMASSAADQDWIVHLDEETFFDGDSVEHILKHCAVQSSHVQSGRQAYGHMGQGVILYNVSSQDNLLCCLADSVRVADDLGKFALQYKLAEQPLIGMHGSFFVCSNAVEKLVGFDHGLEGSITEDAFFAMKCAAEGVHVKWCGGHMYEQSPFTVADFAKQRCRWFTGLWLCVRSRRLPLLHRCVLGSHVVSWAFCPLLNFVAWTNWLLGMARPDVMRVSLALLYAVPVFGYLLGFVWTFSPSRLRYGVPEFALLFFLQVLGVPLFALMEAAGVAKALYERPFHKFELVQKEKEREKPQQEAQSPSSNCAHSNGDNSDASNGERSQELGKRESERPLVEVLSNSSEETSAETAPTLLPVVKPCAPLLLGTSSESCSTFTLSPKGGSTTAEPASALYEFGASSPADLAGHWRALLSGAPCSISVPYDTGPGSGAVRGECITLPEIVGDKLLRAQNACGCAPLADVALAALGFVVSLICNEDILVLGFSNSSTGETLGSEAGLPVRVELNYSRSFPELVTTLGIQRARSEAFSCFGRTTLSEILKNAGGEEWLEQSASKGGPWQFSVYQAPLGGDTICRSAHGADLLLRVASTCETAGGAVHVAWTYNSEAFETATVARWTDCLEGLLLAVAAKPQSQLKDLSVLNEAGEAAALRFAGSSEPFTDKPLHTWFLEQANTIPDAVAVIEEDETRSYSELAELAQGLAARIAMLVGEPKVDQEHWLVGLLFERSFELVVVVYAVLMAGAGYLPMEPDFPPARIGEILLDADSVCRLVLVGSSEMAQKLPWHFTGRVACASTAGLTSPDGSVPLGLCENGDVPTHCVAETASLAYCIYTSGSTGKPKGVMVGHRELAMRTSWLQASFNLRSHNCVPFKTSYIFAVSEWELFWPLVVGARMVVVPRSTVRSPESFSRTLDEARCSHIFLVPSHLAALMQYWTATRSVPTEHLQHIIASGEVLPVEVVQAFIRVWPDAELHNLYGVTEGSMMWKVYGQHDPPVGEILIGKPIANTAVLLLDRWGKLVPIGVPGEIHFGMSIAQGYLNHQEFTAEKFIPNPYSTRLRSFQAVPTLFRTGDFGMWLPSGELRFLGRVDRQVKVRGYRIELGAVEAAMRKAAPKASAVAAIALPSVPERPGGELVAFVEARSEDDSLLRDRLLERLPAYMVPTRLIYRAAFPQLASGKPDLMSLARDAAAGVEAAVAPAADKLNREAGRTTTTLQLDSLGTARKRGAECGNAALEARISDNMRAFMMYGVIFDSWAGCSETGMCKAVIEGMIWRQPLSLQPRLLWVEAILRGIGNYKDMTGFMMVSAYNDSAYDDAAYFSKRDGAVLLTYLQFLWVLDPIFWGICRAGSPDLCNEEVSSFVGVHRWYLLAVLMTKAALVMFRLLRLPPLLQCMLVTMAGFVMPSEVLCLIEQKCEKVNDSKFWVDNFRILDPVWDFFFRGAAMDIFKMFTSVVMRYYVLFGAQYFWAFHYGRPAVDWFTTRFRSSFRLLQLASPVVLLAMELANTSIIGPTIFGFMQEDAGGTFEPRFLQLSLLLIGLSAEVAVMALAASLMPCRLKLLGSTTLGCYMIHMYFTYPVMLLRPNFDSLGDMGMGGFLLQVLLILLLPALAQLTLGAAWHKLLFLELRLLFQICARVQSAACRLFTRPPKHDLT